MSEIQTNIRKAIAKGINKKYCIFFVLIDWKYNFSLKIVIATMYGVRV